MLGQISPAQNFELADTRLLQRYAHHRKQRAKIGQSCRAAAKDQNRKSKSRYVLLMGQVFVDGDKDIEALCRHSEKQAVVNLFPSDLLQSLDIVF